MTRKTIWRSAALQELADASLWYENERPGLGEEFVEAVDLLLAGVQSNPQFFREVLPPIRRVLMKRFPYLVFFYEGNGQIVVLSIHHAKRNPAVWRSRHE